MEFYKKGGKPAGFPPFLKFGSIYVLILYTKKKNIHVFPFICSL